MKGFPISDKLGYYYQIEGRQLFTDISKNINKYRYSTSINENIISLDELEQKANNIFATKPRFDINLGKTHTELAQEFSRISRKKFLKLFRLVESNNK